MLSWLLLINILLCNSQVFPSSWQNNGCIPEDEYFICISLHSLSNLNSIRNYLSYIYIQIVSTASSLSPIYKTNAYRIDNTNSRNIDDVSICFYPDLSTLQLLTSIQLNIYNLTNNNMYNNTFVASYTMQNMNSLNMTTKESAIQLTENWNIESMAMDNILNISQLTHIPQIQFSIWLSSSQCMEITTSTMYFANDYNLNIQMYRLNENNQTTQNTMFESSKFTTYDSSPSFNTILCLSGYPVSSTQGLIGANFTLNDDTTGESYSLYTINKQYTNYYITPNRYWQQTSYDINTLHFAIGNIKMNYWQSCSFITITTTQTVDSFDIVANDVMYYTIILLTSLLFITFICVCSGCYTYKSYKGTDPLHYSNVLWCLLAIWDFSSQVLFAAFLILQITNNDDGGSDELLLTLFFGVCSALLISYLCNLLYLIHYLQIWNDPSSPGVTRHWLELWSWLIIFITMTMGGVHVALEACNSIIIPIDIFAMHLSHSELVRIRKDRFITNVLIQDLPILIVICLYILLFLGLKFTTTFRISDIYLKYLVIINVLLSTFISIIMTTTFRILRRNYSHDNPIAQYQFSFTLKSNEWQACWIHSHKKIQKCFKLAFGLRKLSLTIIDQCSESLNAMKIEGRLLKDNKHKSQRVEKMATDNVTKEEMKEIGLDLLKQFKHEFDILDSDDICIDHLTIKPICLGAEIVYNHTTCVQILCVGFLDCMQAIAHKCCPQLIKSPPNRRQASAAMRMRPIPVTSPVSATFEFNLKKTISTKKTLTLCVEKSKDDSKSTSYSNLPMITISSQLEELRDSRSFEENKENNNKKIGHEYGSTLELSTFTDKEISQSASTRNTMKLDQQTLFADVYNENNQNGLSHVSENKETIVPDNLPHNPPDIINAQEWFAKYKQIKSEIEKTSTDQYGYETKRKITFLSHNEKLKQIAGDAPATFSASTHNLLNNDQPEEVDLYDNPPQNDYMDDDDDDDDDDDEIDI